MHSIRLSKNGPKLHVDVIAKISRFIGNLERAA